jgi:hypothetical protein
MPINDSPIYDIETTALTAHISYFRCRPCRVFLCLVSPAVSLTRRDVVGKDELESIDRKGNCSGFISVKVRRPSDMHDIFLRVSDEPKSTNGTHSVS